MDIKQENKPVLADSDYKQLVQELPDMVLHLSTTGHFIYCNEAFTKITGYNLADVESKTLFQIVKADTRSATRKFYEAHVAEKKPETYLEFPLQCKNGNIVWIGNTTLLKESGNGVFYSARPATLTKKLKQSCKKRTGFRDYWFLLKICRKGYYS